MGSFVWKERLFLGVQGKFIPWCERKDYSLLWNESLFLIQEVMYFLFKRELKKILTNRKIYKEFDGFGQRILPMGKGKTKRETKREKMDFRLG